MYTICGSPNPYIDASYLKNGKDLVANILASNGDKCPFCGNQEPIVYEDFFSCGACGRRGKVKAFMRMLGY